MISGEVLELVREVWRTLFEAPQRRWLVLLIIAVTVTSLTARWHVTSFSRAVRSLRTDLIYAGFYVFGVYGFFIFGPVHRGIEAGMSRWLP